MTLTELASKLRPIIEKAAFSLEDETALQGVQLFPLWKPGLQVNVDERYQKDGILYRVVQQHTTQSDWEPKNTPALWSVVSLEEWPEFVHPTGAHDAYKKGDKVTFDGERYVCNMDGCAWSPSEYPPAWDKQ